MACECCKNARANPEHRQFIASCLWCSARRIQFLQRRLALAPSVCRDRCRAALADALHHGLNEAEVRSLAKQAAPAIEPLPEKPKGKK